MSATTLRNVRLWDGEVDRGAVDLSWEGGAITAVTPRSGDDADDDVTAGDIEPVVADAAAEPLTVIPGLIDTHVHLDTNAITKRADRSWNIVTPPEERSLHIVAHALDALRGGVTTLRELCSEPPHFAVGRVFEAGLLPGPRLLGSGPVGMTAGHGDLFTPPHYPQRPPVADSPDECRKLVRHWARAGSYSIKIYTSGGVLSMGDKVAWRNQTDAEIAATVDEAHALGMLVAAHSHTPEGIDIALRHGVDSIEHATGLRPHNVERLAVLGVPVTPTLLIHERLHDPAAGLDAETVEKSRATTEERDERLRQAAEAGVRFVLGTDANGVFTRFGDQMEEVRLMARLFGWSAERALRSATSDAADAIDLGGTTGRLRPGLAADFVVMRGVPWLETVALDTSRIVAVVAGGRLLHGSL